MSIVTGVVSVLLGGGILSFVQFLIDRHDAKHGKTKEITDSIDRLAKEIDLLKAEGAKRGATQARTHILRFQDELYNGVNHSAEYYLQILDDAKDYEKYCNAHEDFPNGRTEAAVKYIRAEYDRLMNEHKL